MSLDHDLYFFIPKEVPPDIGLMWNLADKYGLKHVKSGQCYSSPVANKILNPRVDYQLTKDGVYIDTLSELMGLDENRRLTMCQYWEPSVHAGCFSTAFVPFSEGAIANFAFSDDDYDDLKEHLHEQGYNIYDFVRDLFIGYRAVFVLSTTDGAVSFKDLLAVAGEKKDLNTIPKAGIGLVAGIGKFDLIRSRQPVIYPDLVIYRGSPF